MLNASLHLVAAVVLMGYVGFWALGVGGVAREAAGSDRERALADLARRSRWLTWTCIAVLAVTGTLMVPKWHVTWEEITTGQLFAARFGAILGAKVLGVAVMIAGFWWVRPTSTVWSRLQLLVGLGVLFLSILLVR